MTAYYVSSKIDDSPNLDASLPWPFIPPEERGYTVREFAKKYRVSYERVRTVIRRGELRAVNMGTKCKPYFVILPEHEREFADSRPAAETKPTRRQYVRRKPVKDFYPD